MAHLERPPAGLADDREGLGGHRLERLVGLRPVLGDRRADPLPQGVEARGELLVAQLGELVLEAVDVPRRPLEVLELASFAEAEDPLHEVGHGVKGTSRPDPGRPLPGRGGAPRQAGAYACGGWRFGASRRPVVDTADALSLVEAYRAGEITRREAAVAIDVWLQTDAGDAPIGLAMLEAVFGSRSPDPEDALLAVVRAALETPDATLARRLFGLAVRRPILAAIAAVDPEELPDRVLRPGERILLRTAGGRRALEAMLRGEVDPIVDWLDRTLLGDDAFSATTWDVPLIDLGGLERLVDALCLATEGLPFGEARAQAAEEWISELAVDSLGDVPSTVIARTVGDRLLGSSAPVLLWHAATQLALVADGDEETVRRVVRRCLPVSGDEAGHVPSLAAAPLLHELPVLAAAALVDSLRRDLSDGSYAALERGFLVVALRDAWSAWRPTALRWVAGPEPRLALAVLRAGERAGHLDELLAARGDAPIAVRSAIDAWLSSRR